MLGLAMHFSTFFQELQDCIVWSIKQFQGRGHSSCNVRLDVGTQRRKVQTCDRCVVVWLRVFLDSHCLSGSHDFTL